MNFQLIGSILNFFQCFGATRIRMDKYTGKLELIKSRRSMYLNRFAIFLCFIHWALVANVLLRVAKGRQYIPLVDVIYIVKIIISITAGIVVHAIPYFQSDQIVHYFNVFLHFQHEVEEKWRGSFDKIWHNVDTFLKCMISILFMIFCVFLLRILILAVRDGEPIMTSFMPGSSVIMRPVLTVFIIYVSFIYAGVTTLVMYVLLIYIIVTWKGIRMLGNERLSEDSMLMYRKYELVNKTFNAWAAGGFIPITILTLGKACIIHFFIVVRTFGVLSFEPYFECLMTLSANVTVVALFMLPAASIHKSSASVLFTWRERSDQNSTIIADAIVTTETAENPDQNQSNFLLQEEPTNAKGDPNVETLDTPCSDRDTKTIIGIDFCVVTCDDSENHSFSSTVDPDMRLKQIVKSMKPFGIQVASFYILKKSTAINFFQIIMDIAVNLLLASKRFKI